MCAAICTSAARWLGKGLPVVRQRSWYIGFFEYDWAQEETGQVFGCGVGAEASGGALNRRFVPDIMTAIGKRYNCLKKKEKAFPYCCHSALRQTWNDIEKRSS